jgi:hypothetical protein
MKHRYSKAWSSLAGCALLAAAAPSKAASPPACGPDGFVNAQTARHDKLAYLRSATQTFDPSNVVNVLAHLARERVDPSYRRSGVVPSNAWDADLATLANLEDGRDFTALYELYVLFGYADDRMLAPGLVDKVEDALLDFKYWYTEPTAPGLQDTSYYWSENHEVIYATLEYLMGQAYPDVPFGNDGRLGSAHAAGARARLLAWFDARSRFGFSEWHSNVYYQKDITPLLALVDFGAEDDVRTLAASTLDALFFDLALHNEKAAFGVTHGRSYKKNVTGLFGDDTWNITKLLFQNTSYDYKGADPGGVLLARSENYELPEAIRRVGVSRQPFVDRERMGIAINETGPVNPAAAAPYGLSYTDPKYLDLWWGMNAFATWPVVPLTLQTMNAYDLWTNPQLALLGLLEPYVSSPVTAQAVVAQTAPMTDLYLLNEVNTYTWRGEDAMLSTALDYRKGFRAAQVHSWQATLDAQAVVFTNHPATPIVPSTHWADDSQDGGYFTGEATMPRSAQFENVGIHIYAPQYPIQNAPPLDMFTYQPFTHAFFPQDRFDEVARDGHWIFGRRGDGYVALYSYRSAEFLSYDPAVYATDGHTLPFDLVASGGADNVWIVEVGTAADWGSFAAFRSAVGSALVEVQSLGASTFGVSPGYSVTYDSPSAGELSFGWTAPLTVNGNAEAQSSFQRFDNPWARAPFTSQQLQIDAAQYSVALDFAAKTRSVKGPGSGRH